jgi:RNA polymerase sigma factor (sigma-70 family)
MSRRLHHLWRRAARPDAGADDDLLRRFRASADGAAFAELVARHGPVVYAAARRLLASPADVEDCFQATFLVLVARAGSLADVPLGPWLYRVAVHTARNLRRKAIRRAAGPLPPGLAAPPSPAADPDLDAAILALPAKERAAIVLCHLYGHTRREAADRLGCPEGTLSARLARGLARLRRRLADPPAVAVPTALAATAVRAAVRFQTTSVLPPAVAGLTRGVLVMMTVRKWAAAGLVALAVAAVGVAVSAGPPGDDLAKQRADAERDLAAARARVKELEARKADLDERAKRTGVPEKPLIVVSVADRKGRGPDIEVTEYVGNPPRSLGTVGCSTVAVWQVYLGRARRDPTAPSDIEFRVAADYPAAKLKELMEAAKVAGFDALRLRAVTLPAVRPEYVIEPPDVLKIEAFIHAVGPGDEWRNFALTPQPVAGEYVVRPDGTVFLGLYGPVSVAGLTVEQARAAVRERISESKKLTGPAGPTGELAVVLDVSAVNSKCYYVITDVGDEQVVRFPLTGSETVLDAVANVAGLAAVAAAGDVWVRRDTPGGKPQVLPVDWKGITREGGTATNYQLLPNDRVVVRRK